MNGRGGDTSKGMRIASIERPDVSSPKVHATLELLRESSRTFPAILTIEQMPFGNSIPLLSCGLDRSINDECHCGASGQTRIGAILTCDLQRITPGGNSRCPGRNSDTGRRHRYGWYSEGFFWSSFTKREVLTRRIPEGALKSMSLERYFDRYAAALCTSTCRISTCCPPPSFCHDSLIQDCSIYRSTTIWRCAIPVSF